MQTYFWVYITTVEKKIRLGPYITLEQATEIMIEHIPALAPSLGASDVLACSVAEEGLNGQEWIHLVQKVEWFSR